MPNPDLDPKVKLISVYNAYRAANNKDPLEVTDYNFGVPEEYSGPKSTKNTKIILTPTPTSPAYGTIILYYNRIDLANLTGFSVEKGSATTVLGLLDKINEELGVELTPMDVEEAALGAGSSFTLTVTDQCMIFYGSTTIGLT
jgi:hypothetical protein